MELARKKKWKTNSIGRVCGIIDDALYSLALYRQISARERNNDVFDPTSRRLWVTISNNAIQMFAIHWCKVFGSKNNKTHFSRFVKPEIFLRKIESIPFDKVSIDMRNFRNKYVAHDEDVRVTIPYFDNAIQIVDAFLELVNEEYGAIPLPSVRDSIEGYQLQIKDCLKQYNIDEC